jgi:drug/metabolite transporter (DMT)-like permease
LLFWIPASIANVAVAGLPHMTPAAWLGILYLGIPSTAVAYVIWMIALNHVDAARAAPTLYLQPLFGIVLARVLLGERPDLATFTGGACIILGVAIAGRGASRDELTSAVAVEPLVG